MKAIKFKFKKEWSLWVVAMTLTVFLIGYTVYAVRSLARAVSQAFVEEPPSGALENNFNFENFDNILKAKGLPVPAR